MRAKDMIAGKPTLIGGKTFIVPPAPLAAVRKYPDYFNGLADPDMLIMQDITLFALQRNYPEMTLEELDAMQDIKTLNESFRAVMDVSGMEKPESGEADAGNP